MFIEKDIRGSLSTITHRYAKADNPKINGHDKSKATSYKTY